jgi:molybdopterin/thiamine biosynthesis adenylyltransferase
VPETDLATFLQPYLIRQEIYDQPPFYSVTEEGLRKLALQQGQGLNAAMLYCLESGIWPERFRAQKGTYPADDQIRLLKATVAVIGAGGLGGAVCLSLARVGVGNLRICDGDGFDQSNLNRQMISSMDRLGRNKAECAAEAIKDISPGTQVTVFPIWADENNLPDILGKADAVVDCLDNLKSRYLVEQAARDKGIPFVHGAIAGQEGMVMTVFPDEPGLKDLYGPVPPEKSRTAETVLGVPTITPLITAGFQASETVNVLLGRSVASRRRFVHVDVGAMVIDVNELA